MKTMTPVLLAVLVGVCAIPYLYGFKKAFSNNPFICSACFTLLAGTVLFVVALLYGKIQKGYVAANWLPIVLATVGIIGTNVLAYVIVNRFGASYWIIASLSNLLIAPSVVGYLLFREKCNVWIIPAVFCAVLSVVFFTMSKTTHEPANQSLQGTP